MSVIHSLKEQKGNVFTTMCGKNVPQRDTTVWWSRITCSACKAPVLMRIQPEPEPEPPRVRYIKRR